VGLWVIDGRTIAVNATILANFMGVKPNSVRLSLRTHHIPRSRRLPPDLPYDFVNRRNWNIHEAQDDLFGKNWKSALRYDRHPGKSSVSCNQNNDGTYWNEQVDDSDFDSAFDFYSNNQ
jgi:hypothetical protein